VPWAKAVENWELRVANSTKAAALGSILFIRMVK
jgi:hypothetical protein